MGRTCFLCSACRLPPAQPQRGNTPLDFAQGRVTKLLKQAQQHGREAR